MKRMLVLGLAYLLITIISGCGGGGGKSHAKSGPPERSVSIEPSLPPKTSIIGTPVLQEKTFDVDGITGSEIALDGLLDVSFQPGTWQGNQSVSLSTTADEDIGLMFDVASEITDTNARVAHEYHVNIGSQQPAQDAIITIKISDDILNATGDNLNNIIVYVLQENSTDEETLLQFLPLQTRQNENNNTIEISIEPVFFTDLISGGKGFETVIVLGVRTESDPTSINRLSTQQALGPVTGGLNAPLTILLDQRSGFGWRTSPEEGMHQGIDLAVKQDVVIAAYDGVVEPRLEKDKNGIMRPKGYGVYALIRHLDGSKTVYAHLDSIAKEGMVKKGEAFATSGKTGTKRWHLHFEYIPSDPVPPDVLPPKTQRVDPAPKIQLLDSIKMRSGRECPENRSDFQLFAYDKDSLTINTDSKDIEIELADMTWSSSNESIASVDKRGFVTWKSDGPFTITANQTSSGRSKNVVCGVSSFVWDAWQTEFSCNTSNEANRVPTYFGVFFFSESTTSNNIVFSNTGLINKNRVIHRDNSMGGELVTYYWFATVPNLLTENNVSIFYQTEHTTYWPDGSPQIPFDMKEYLTLNVTSRSGDTMLGDFELEMNYMRCEWHQREDGSQVCEYRTATGQCTGKWQAIRSAGKLNYEKATGNGQYYGCAHSILQPQIAYQVVNSNLYVSTVQADNCLNFIERFY